LHHAGKDSFSFGQGVDDPDMQTEIKNQGEPSQSVHDPGPGPQKTVVSYIKERFWFVQGSSFPHGAYFHTYYSTIQKKEVQ